MNRALTAVLMAVIFVLLMVGISCSSQNGAAEKAYRLGEKAQAGPLIYTVSSAEWSDRVGEGSEARTPVQRFLLVRLSVTNSGAGVSAIPSTELVDRNGKAYAEISDGRGVSDWMGTVRMVQAAQTEHGVVLFDASPGDYSLRVRHEAESDKQSSALIEIPYRPESKPEPGA